MRRIDYIAIHCSATRANVDENITLPGEDIGVKEIRKWHTDPEPQGRGWSDIGYHYVIRRSGEVEVGRPLERAGAHVAGYNSCSIGICLVGGVSESGQSENNFKPKQWEALKPGGPPEEAVPQGQDTGAPRLPQGGQGLPLLRCQAVGHRRGPDQPRGVKHEGNLVPDKLLILADMGRMDDQDSAGHHRRILHRPFERRLGAAADFFGHDRHRSGLRHLAGHSAAAL